MYSMWYGRRHRLPLKNAIYAHTWVGTFRNNWKQETNKKRTTEALRFREGESETGVTYGPKKKKKEAYNTCCSQAATHPSTKQALHCLTSVTRRELVYSVWYGRRHRLPLKNVIYAHTWVGTFRTNWKPETNKNKTTEVVRFREGESETGVTYGPKKTTKKKPATPAVPRRSPIQVLSRPDTA